MCMFHIGTVSLAFLSLSAVRLAWLSPLPRICTWQHTGSAPSPQGAAAALPACAGPWTGPVTMSVPGPRPSTGSRASPRRRAACRSCLPFLLPGSQQCPRGESRAGAAVRHGCCRPRAVPAAAEADCAGAGNKAAAVCESRAGAAVRHGCAACRGTEMLRSPARKHESGPRCVTRITTRIVVAICVARTIVTRTHAQA